MLCPLNLLKIANTHLLYRCFVDCKFSCVKDMWLILSLNIETWFGMLKSRGGGGWQEVLSVRSAPPPPGKFKLSNFQNLKHVVKLMNKNLWYWAPLTNKIIFRIPPGGKNLDPRILICWTEHEFTFIIKSGCIK